MAAENVQNDKSPSPVTPNPAATSCRMKKSEQASFLEDIKDHMDEFIHASMDEHKTCFKKTVQKVLPILSPQMNAQFTLTIERVEFITSTLTDC